jgi:signal recognition particle receptor subunit beta
MVFVNYTTMQMTAKIVYYGPGLCGKTTNLKWIHSKTAPRSRGEMVSLETEGDRTLFFDLLPLDVGIIGGMKVRLQLYTVPGQVFYNATRRLVLKGADGVVFVADSQVPALEPNEESLANLWQNLEELGLNKEEALPIVFQYNKRDLARNLLPVDKLEHALNPGMAPSFEAAAIHGVGVFETLKEISRLALDSVRRRVAEDAPAEAGKPVFKPSPKEEEKEREEEEEEVEVAPAPAAATEATPPTPTETAAPAASAADPALMEPIEVEFAEEDTGKLRVRPVMTRGSLDIGKELEKLREMAGKTRTKAKTPTAVKDRDADALVQDLVETDPDAAQEVKRRAALEVPPHLLKGLTDLRIHLGFDRDGREEILRDCVRVTLVGTRRLKSLRLHLDLDLTAKD